MPTSKASPRPSDGDIDAAAAAVRDGGLVIFPTETVYGIGADATNAAAIAEIFQLKRRPAHNPLITHVSSLQAAEQIGEFSTLAHELANAFWPGPLTLIVPKRPDTLVAPAVSAELPTIAIRVPAHPVGRAFLRKAGLPIAAPSANISGRLSPTRATDVLPEVSEQSAYVLDAGPCEHGLESTVVDTTGPAPCLMRPGAITAAALTARLGLEITSPDLSQIGRPPSPGMLLRHYAPLTPIRLNATTVARDEVLLAFGPPLDGPLGFTLNLSVEANLTEAAANLYHMLHVLDRRLARRIAVVPIPNHGLGEVINERLLRAAASHADR